MWQQKGSTSSRSLLLSMNYDNRYFSKNRISSRLFNLLKAAVNIAAETAIDTSVNVLISKACEKIEINLKMLYKKTARNSIISFTINLLGILCLGIKPFGKQASIVIASTFFAAAGIFFIIRSIRFIKTYGKQGLSLMNSIKASKSIHKGIEKYVYSNFPAIAFVYAGINIGEIYLPALKKIPDIPQLIDSLAGLFWKRLALYAGIVASYTIIIFGIIKPLLIYKLTK